jgi:hypothetical protein
MLFGIGVLLSVSCVVFDQPADFEPVGNLRLFGLFCAGLVFVIPGFVLVAVDYSNPLTSSGNRAIAVLSFVIGGLHLVGALFSWWMAAMVRGGQAGSTLGAGTMGSIAVLWLIAGGGGIAVGVGVLNLTSCGRILGFVLGRLLLLETMIIIILLPYW